MTSTLIHRRVIGFLWFTTTSWMMWNVVVSALLRGATIVLTDGDPLWPDIGAQWALGAETQATFMGTSPAYLMSCRKSGFKPAERYRLAQLRQLGVTGSPLPTEGFDWVAEQFGDAVYLNPTSGGTDICSGFVGGGPGLPVVPGAIAGRWLGVDAVTVDGAGEVVVEALGELVVRSPMPSMASDVSGTMKTEAATAQATSKHTPAYGGTVIGRNFVLTVVALFRDDRMRRSIAAVSDWEPVNSTVL